MAWSRRDQIEAYQFLRRRSTSALVVAEPDHPQPPTRRYLAATIGGAVAVLVALGGFGVYGLLRPGGSTNWNQPGTILVQKESNTRYVLGSDGHLHQVRNYTSARLYLNLPSPPTVSLSAASLKHALQGALIGIPDAPDALPQQSDLRQTNWTICEDIPTHQSNLATTVLVDDYSADSAVAGAVLVRDPEKAIYLINQGHRFKIGNPEVLQAFNYSSTPINVPADWLNAVPAGSDLTFPAVADRGRTPDWRPPRNALVGQVLRVFLLNRTSSRYYLVEKAGLRPLSTVDADLALHDPSVKKSYPNGAPVAVDVDESELPKYTLVNPAVMPNYPAEPPVLSAIDHPDDVALCARVSTSGVDVRVVKRTVVDGWSALTVPTTAGHSRQVAVASGTGAIVRAGGPGGMIYLVTDQLRRYPIPDQEARAALGFGTTVPYDLPTQVLELLPQGPTLNKEAAAHTALPTSATDGG